MQTMTKHFGLALVLVAATGLTGTGAAHAMGYGDTQPRAMGMAGAYTAMARGAEAIYWNPANLALSDGPKMSLPITIGASAILENNSLSIADYNKYNGEFIESSDKDDILQSIDRGDGLQFNTDLGLFLPLVSGAVFPLPWNITSAVAVNLRLGMEGSVPRDMIELLLYGNEFARDRVADGRDPNYDIATWDGEFWGLGVFNWSVAKPWMPWKLMPYLDEMTVGATVKVLGGLHSEVLRSDGGVQTRVGGIRTDAYAVARGAGGFGAGVDLGVAGVTKDRKTTISASLVNLLDYMSWSIETMQDCVFVSGRRIRVTSFTGKANFDEVFDNPREVKTVDPQTGQTRVDTVLRDEVDAAVWEDGNPIFHKEIEIDSYTKSLPGMLRFGVAHKPIPRLTVAVNYDQAFSSGYGISTTPRVSVGTEYRLVDWFPVRFGLSGGGRAGRSAAVGFAFGPFTVKRFRMTLMETSVVNRGGFFPGVSQGVGYSLNFIRMRIKRAG